MAGRIWKWDTYDIRKYEPWSIKTVIDVGANVGGFSLMCKVLFPVATVIALEPNLDAYKQLIATAGCWGIKCYNLALGPDNSELISIRPEGQSISGWARFITKEEDTKNQETYSIKSFLLSSLFERFKVDTDYPYIIKVDCEGGEKHILDDEKVIPLIKKSLQTSLELHFKYGGSPEKWYNYLQQFKDTHSIFLCSWYRDQYRRHYIYRQFEFEEIKNLKLCEIQLLRLDWWKYRRGVPLPNGLYGDEKTV